MRPELIFWPFLRQSFILLSSTASVSLNHAICSGFCTAMGSLLHFHSCWHSQSLLSWVLLVIGFKVLQSCVEWPSSLLVYFLFQQRPELLMQLISSSNTSSNDFAGSRTDSGGFKQKGEHSMRWQLRLSVDVFSSCASFNQNS